MPSKEDCLKYSVEIIKAYAASSTGGIRNLDQELEKVHKKILQLAGYSA